MAQDTIRRLPAPRQSAPLPWWAWDAGVALAALLSLLAWDASDADLGVMQAFGTSAGFAWHAHWLTAQVLHGGGRLLSLLLLLALALQLWRPLSFARALPLAIRLWWLGTTLACLLLIPLVKSRSLVSCPWDLAEFGGTARYLPHWTLQAWQGLGDGGPGRCFPSGHASGAFSFVTGWFALRGTSGRAARRWLAGIVLLGLLFGVAQVLRGAHYPSHVAWTAWLCWAMSALAWHAARLPLRRATSGQAAGRAQARSATRTDRPTGITLPPALEPID